METITKKHDTGKSKNIDFKELNKSIEQKNKVLKSNAVVLKEEDEDKPE